MAKIAVITGASSGIGKLFAEELAGYPDVEALWIIARREDLLEQLAMDIFQKHNKYVRVFPLDLTLDQHSLSIALEEERPEVRWLVNNAGEGVIGRVDEIGLDEQLSMIDLNNRALVEVDQRFLPFCGIGTKILHTASVAAFLPQPEFAVYAATKAFTYSYSRALHRELESRGITVTALCPNPMDTPFFEKSTKQEAKKIKNIGMEDPKKVVQTALKRAKRGKDTSIASLIPRLIKWSARLLPHNFIFWVEKKMGLYR